ncbi:homeobox-leucine zipper protein ATHB-52-like [Salvia hispanica]|uniref:homeobox-leucine zipper protein ATHB-52-like n=1 Tax=Salvia hispanica TaxID=49212 RepID=UPI002009B014|nr:homeobox-leucine zipper protein ATHB-52-like [Salvia hispanica]
MDQFPYPAIPKQQTKEKKRLSEEQVRILEWNFNFNKKLDPDHKSRLAFELGIPPRQVAIWYQNKRARDKIQGLEMEHKGVQMQLESVLIDNSRLRKEVEMLKVELTRAQGATGPTFTSFNSSNFGVSSRVQDSFYD